MIAVAPWVASIIVGGYGLCVAALELYAEGLRRAAPWAVLGVAGAVLPLLAYL